MTANEDSEIIAWILFSKGDIEAHPFHGNQYSTGQSGAEVPRQVDTGRFQVASDRFGSKPASNPNSDRRIKSDPTDTSPKGIAHWTKSIHYALLRGENPIISGKNFPTLIGEMARQGTSGNDITHLRISGFRLIGQDSKGYSRKQMPQIEGSERPRFLKDIEKKYGITAKPMSMNPLGLRPIQKEINGDKSGGIMRANPKGIPDSMRILVSSDGYVVDGHHTWAAAVGLKLGGSQADLPVYQLSCDWKTAIDTGLAWDKENGVESKGFDKSYGKIAL